MDVPRASGVLPIDRATAQHLLGMPGWRLCQTDVRSCADTYYFEGHPAGPARRNDSGSVEGCFRYLER